MGGIFVKIVQRESNCAFLAKAVFLKLIIVRNYPCIIIRSQSVFHNQLLVLGVFGDGMSSTTKLLFLVYRLVVVYPVAVVYPVVMCIQ